MPGGFAVHPQISKLSKGLGREERTCFGGCKPRGNFLDVRNIYLRSPMGTFEVRNN